MEEKNLTHVDASGAARMVDVTQKEMTQREAIAEGSVTMREETLALILSDSIKKGDVFAAARIAGIMAAKKTSELIPMCHPLPIESVSVTLTPVPPTTVKICAKVCCVYRTGVEMEAMTAVSVAALTIYDMCKAVDRGMEISNIRLVEKSGGKSGLYRRAENV